MHILLCKQHTITTMNVKQKLLHIYHHLSGITQDDIEVKIRRNVIFYYDGILVDILQLYTQ